MVRSAKEMTHSIAISHHERLCKAYQPCAGCRLPAGPSTCAWSRQIMGSLLSLTGRSEVQFRLVLVYVIYDFVRNSASVSDFLAQKGAGLASYK